MAEYSNPEKRLDYIDIDPFGSSVPYISYALKALRKDGVIAATSTDMAPLCGVHSKACYRHYGAKPLRTEYCHELAVRILCGFITVTAARVDLAVKILFCHSTDHYIRTYIQISKGAEKANKSISQLGFVYHCFKCLNRKFVFEPFPNLTATCNICGAKLNFAGPLWLGELHNKDTVKEIFDDLSMRKLGQRRRVWKILEKILGEIDAPPTYFVLTHLCDSLDIPTPQYSKVLKKIRSLGYSAVPTHFHSSGIKTDIPLEKFQTILKEE